MRQGQQNRRGRGRHNNGGHNNNYGNNNNNNRKGQNPLARSYESNGPDVKIRGNPAHIAEKYMTLARDAQSSGDSVLAEAYLQHAEHYNRIIMAFREQQQQQGGGGEGQYRQRHQPESGDPSVDGQFDDGDESGAGGEPIIRGQEPQPGMFDAQPPQFGERSFEQQPVREDRGNREERGPRGYDDRQPRRHDGNRDRDGGRRERYEGQRNFGGNRDDRPERRERFDRFQGQDRGQDRNQGGERTHDRNQGERGFQDRQSQERPIADRQPADRGHVEAVRAPVEVPIVVAAEAEIAPASQREAREPREAPAPRRRQPPADRFADGQQEQPEFLRRPVRRPRREAPAAAEAADAPAAGEEPSSKD